MIPSGRSSARTTRFLADLEDPARAQAEFDGFFGRSSFAEAVDRFVCFDLAAHGGDLARVTGQGERIDPDELLRLWQATAIFGDALRGESTCGPAVDPPPDADEQARLLAFLGRHP